MVRTQVSFDAEMYERARKEARRLEVSFAELCRRAVAQLLRQRSEEGLPWMDYAGAIETGAADASQSVDDVVYGRERP